MPGTLYLVSTPIGNLGDMTMRAVETLSSVSAVACEDTRTTGKLLRHFNIEATTVSYHDHNEAERAPRLIDRLLEGQDVALVSDAGTPLLSDPGYRLVRAARERGIPVRAVPGASALLAALVVAGMPASSFTFLGFVPSRGTSRRAAIEAAVATPSTFILYEAPTRLERLLTDLANLAPSRPACVCREMTKFHEEHREGTLADLAAWSAGRRFKGEITLVVGPASPARPAVSAESLGPEFRELREQGLSAREASKRLARAYGLSSREVYARFGK